MIMKIDRENLGELVHKSGYYIPIDFDDDFMGHTNNSNYDNLTEIIRLGIFLPSCGMSLPGLKKKGYG